MGGKLRGSLREKSEETISTVSSNAKVRCEGFIVVNPRVKPCKRTQRGCPHLIRAINRNPACSICTSTLNFGSRMITMHLLGSRPLGIGNISAIHSYYQELAMKRKTDFFKGESRGRQELNFCDCC